MSFFYEKKGRGMTAWHSESLAFGAHLHGHYELIYMVEGRSRAFVDSKEYDLVSGDVFLVFPNQIHYYQKIDLEVVDIVIFPEDFSTELEALFRNKLPVCPVVHTGKKKEIIAPMIHLLSHQGPNYGPQYEGREQAVWKAQMEHKPFGPGGVWYDIKMKGYLMIVLSEICELMEFAEAKQGDMNTVKQVLNYCSQHYQNEISLDSVAADLHISKYHISHIFNEKLHMGFCDYVGAMRVSKACELLKKDEKSITEIAYEVGFNSTRTFNRIFFKFEGTQPRKYQKKMEDKGMGLV